jgi:iron complex outermembrane recepter protein
MSWRKRCTFASATLMAVVALSTPALAQAKSRFDLPAQPLADSLRTVASQNNLNLLFDPPLVASRAARPLKGEFTTTQAFKLLLADTGIYHEFLNERTVVLAPVRASSPAGGRRSATSRAQAGPESVTTTFYANGALSEEPSFWSRFRVAQGNGQSVPERSDGSPSSQREPAIEEIIVTAQKRQERLQDVPVPVTSLNTESLTVNNQLRLEDYYSKVPGLSLSLVGNADAAPSVSIRGLTMGGQTNPTVSVVIDEIPYGSTVISGSDLSVADIDPGDLARVEVLRGPQGTLYGAASIGGLIKFATIEPSTEKLAGRLHAGLSTVSGGDDIGFNLRAAVNMPVSSSFAIRASGFTVRDPGYIDNIQTGEDDVNERKSNGGRVAALWQASEDVSLRLSALVQDIERDGSADVTFLPGVGDLEQQSIPNTGGYERSTEAFGATLQAELGGIGFTSATGYSVDETASVQDVSTTGIGTFFAPTFFPGATGAIDFLSRKVDKLTQEVRFSVPFGKRYEWLVGLFYTREKIQSAADFWAANAGSGAPVGRIIDVRQLDTRFEEYAAFTDLTVNFTERFDVQFGGRWAQNEQDFSLARTGPGSDFIFGSDPSFVGPVDSNDDPLTYLVTPRFRVSPNLTAYARLASGYRPGAPNVNCGLDGTPCQSDADTTRNYELGFKGNLGGKILFYDASLFYIDWEDVQLEVVPAGGFGFTGNGGSAKSQGIELAVESNPTARLNLSGWVAWNEAELTKIPSGSTIVAQSGDRLPYGSRWSGNFSLEHEFPLWNTATGFIGGSVSYVGARKGVFLTVPGARQDFPSYTQTDLRAGARFDTWTINAFVNNVSDKRALLGGGAGFFIEAARNYTQPRTIGLSLAKTF